jgi:hypothetical protein
MRGISKRLAALAATAIISLGVSVTEAQADSSYWPSNGEVVTKVNGNHHSITLAFSLDQSQLDGLRQQGAYLELDFIAYDAGIAGDSGDYELYTNIPGALKDVPFLDRTFTPGVTAIETAKLQAGTHYYATIKWYSSGLTTPQISVDFVPSRWAGSDVARNWGEQIVSCANGFINTEYAWCIFPIEGARHKLLSPLHGGLVPADGSTYSLHPSVIDGAPRNFA